MTFSSKTHEAHATHCCIDSLTQDPALVHQQSANVEFLFVTPQRRRLIQAHSRCERRHTAKRRAQSLQDAAKARQTIRRTLRRQHSHALKRCHLGCRAVYGCSPIHHHIQAPLPHPTHPPCSLTTTRFPCLTVLLSRQAPLIGNTQQPVPLRAAQDARERPAPWPVLRVQVRIRVASAAPSLLLVSVMLSTLLRARLVCLEHAAVTL